MQTHNNVLSQDLIHLVLKYLESRNKEEYDIIKSEIQRIRESREYVYEICRHSAVSEFLSERPEFTKTLTFFAMTDFKFSKLDDDKFIRQEDVNSQPCALELKDK